MDTGLSLIATTMTKSDTIKELAGALCKFQASMGAITKDAMNPFFKSKYASLSAIIEDTREPLAKQGLSFAQFPAGYVAQDTGESVPLLNTILMHTSGEWMEEKFPISPVDGKPQSLGSAITYARRYALCAILGLQVEDDDGNEASKPAAKAAAPKQKPMVPDTRKAKIKALVDGKAINPVESYPEYVMENTGLELVAENYDAIIAKLQEK